MEKGTGLIVGSNGEPISTPTIQLDAEDARLLRLYKKLLEKYGLREALYCNECWNGSIPDGCEAHVTGSSILIKCRCRLRFYSGATY